LLLEFSFVLADTFELVSFFVGGTNLLFEVGNTGFEKVFENLKVFAFLI
jgi:hypothetical protein